MVKKNLPRRQHHITQAYLKIFCTVIKKKKKNRYSFWVYSFEKNEWRPSQPLNEAVEVDFQKLDHFIGLDPYYFEGAFSTFEGDAVAVINDIALTGCIPKSLEEFSLVINLMGLFAGRNVFVRKMIEESRKEHTLNILKAVHKDESIFRAHIGKVLEDYSIGWPCFSSYLQSKAFLEGRKFRVDSDRSIIVEEMIKAASALINLFGCQNWMLLEAMDGEFITSNKPVNPVWATGFSRHMPIFGSLDTFIVFPITPKFALLGSSSPLPSHRKIDRLIVEGINWVTVNTGATELFSRSKDCLPKFEGLFHLQTFHRLLSTRLIEMT